MNDLEKNTMELSKKYMKLSPSLICRCLKVDKKTANNLYFFYLKKIYIDARRLKKSLLDNM